MFRRLTVRTWIWSIVLLSACGDEAMPYLESKERIREWVRVETVLSHEFAEWENEKNQLNYQMELLSQEYKLLEERLSGSEQLIEKGMQRRLDLIQSEKDLETQESSLLQEVDLMERYIQTMFDRLPPCLKEKVDVHVRKISLLTDEAGTLSARWQNVFHVLMAVWDFDSKMTCVREIMPQADGQLAEVEVLYAGLSQAWYVGVNNAGSGYPGEHGWQWTHDPSLTDEVRQAIQIVNAQNMDIKYLELPFDLREAKPK